MEILSAVAPRRDRAVVALLCFGWILGACDSTPGSGTPGELGDGTFDYRCQNSGDLKCSQTDAVDEFEIGTDLGGNSLPLAVAVGATFGIRYAGSVRDGGDEVLVVVDAVSLEDKRGPDVYSISQPADAAFVATDEEGNAIDFAVLTALEATELTLWSDQAEAYEISIGVGERVSLTVAPRSDAGTFLSGALPYEWTTLDPSIATIGELGTSGDDVRVRNEGDIELVGVAEGTVVVRVRSSDLEATVDVEVTQ